MAFEDWDAAGIDNVTEYSGTVYKDGHAYTVDYKGNGLWRLVPQDPDGEEKFIASGTEMYEDYSPTNPDASKETTEDPSKKKDDAAPSADATPKETKATDPATGTSNPEAADATDQAEETPENKEATATDPTTGTSNPEDPNATVTVAAETPKPEDATIPEAGAAETQTSEQVDTGKQDNTSPTIPKVTHEQWKAKVTELMQTGKYNSMEEAEAAASAALGVDGDPGDSNKPAPTAKTDEEDHDNTTPTIPRVSHQQWEDKVVELMKSGKYNSVDEAEAAASAALGIKSEADTIPDDQYEKEEAEKKAREEKEAKDREKAIEAYKKLHPGATDEEAAAAVDADKVNGSYDLLSQTYSNQRKEALTNAGMKDYSSVDFDSIEEVTADWARIISSFQGYIEGKAAECEGFKLAQDAGVENGIVKSLDDRITNIITMLSTASDTVKSVAALLLQTDEDVGKDAPENPSGGNDDKGKPDPSPTPTPPPSGGNKGKDNYKDQIELLKNLNMSDLSDLTDELIKYCKEHNIELDKLINDENYASQLKLALLDSETLSNEMKTKIMEGLESATQKAIKDILTGTSTEQIGLNTDTTLVIKETLTRVANENQTSLENLLKDDKYAKIVKEAIGNISKDYSALGTKDDPTKNLESIIKKELVKSEGTGDTNVIDLNADTNNIVAKYIKVFASNKNITNVDDLLKNEELISSLKTLGNVSAFTDNISKFGDSTTQSILQNLLVGGSK